MMLAHKYLRVMVLDRVAVLDSHIEAYLGAHPELLKNPERARVRQIVVHDQAAAQKVTTALAGRTSFIDVARALSITPESVTGGDLGVLTRDRLPATVADVVFRLPVKKVSNPLVLHDGIHFYWVSEKFAPSPLSLTQARPRAEAILRRQAEARAAQQHIEALRRSAQVTKQEISLAHIL
jgi:parvulin-like peptidyl-prolyl isomerase